MKNKILYGTVGVLAAIPATVALALFIGFFLVTDPVPQGRDIVKCVKRKVFYWK